MPRLDPTGAPLHAYAHGSSDVAFGDRLASALRHPPQDGVPFLAFIIEWLIAEETELVRCDCEVSAAFLGHEGTFGKLIGLLRSEFPTDEPLGHDALAFGRAI